MVASSLFTGSAGGAATLRSAMANSTTSHSTSKPADAPQPNVLTTVNRQLHFAPLQPPCNSVFGSLPMGRMLGLISTFLKALYS
jgi:hypothetical protein